MANSLENHGATEEDTMMEGEQQPEVESSEHVANGSTTKKHGGSRVVKQAGQNVIMGAATIVKSAAHVANVASKETVGLAKNLAKVASKKKPSDKESDHEASSSIKDSSVSSATTITTSNTTKSHPAKEDNSKTSANSKAASVVSLKQVDPSPPSNAASPLTSSLDLIMDDHMIVWIVVASIGILQIIENISRIAANQFPFSVVMASMLVGFTIGLEMDGNTLIRQIKGNLLGLAVDDDDDDDDSTTDKSLVVPRETNTIDGANATDQTLPKSSLSRFFKRRKESIKHRIPQITVLQRKLSRNQKDKAVSVAHHRKVFDVNLLKRLQRFRTYKSSISDTASDSDEPPTLIPDTTAAAAVEYTMGSTDINKAQAAVLLKKLDVTPLFELRGLDIFLADTSEAEMSNHPFLLKNGLRDIPTFVLNMMTQWGNLLIYMQMPDWVEDFGASIVESENDTDEVKALKRFLNGSDDYRKARLKFVPEIIEAPYAVRLMTPKGKEITLEIPNFLSTSYRSHDVAGKLSPVIEVTLDLMGNSTMRGMASLVKRYLSGISVDFAIVIGRPDDAPATEPEACLGLCRMDHLDVTRYPQLPDRFETEGCSKETVDSIRASMLVKHALTQSSKFMRTSSASI